MEEEAPVRRSVAELAGRFKGPATPLSPATNEADKPVRRRPPRTLQLPKPQEDEQEPPSGVISPQPSKVKRNSALIEKLQSSLALSPSAPSPKSPGFRLLPPGFTPPSPGSAPASTVTTSPSETPTSPTSASTPLTEDETPASFEDAPAVTEGSILPNIIKGRARHSIRRRPPSRRHRKSSGGEESGVTNEGESHQNPESEAGDKTTGEAAEVFETEGETDASAPPPEESKPHEEETKSSDDVKDGDVPSSEQNEGEEEKAEEKSSEEPQKLDVTEEPTDTEEKSVKEETQQVQPEEESGDQQAQESL